MSCLVLNFESSFGISIFEHVQLLRRFFFTKSSWDPEPGFYGEEPIIQEIPPHHATSTAFRKPSDLSG